MPYKLPEGFFVRSAAANREAIHRAAQSNKDLNAYVVGLFVAATTLLAAVAGVQFFERHDCESYIEELCKAPADIVYELTCDIVEYPEYDDIYTYY